ncbi:MAG: glycoside hydrolase family 2 TIM barrel-domain containing protein, partial [Chitinophagaceae bacterium]
MQKIFTGSIIIFSILISFNLSGQVNENPPIRKIINIDKGWKFHEGRLSNAQAIGFNDANWETVNVPHDWRIHEPYNKNNRQLSGYLPKGIGWYRKVLDIRPQYKGSRIFISFDGVFRNYTVWVNGKEAGWHLSGYTGCVLDITKLVNFNSGKNILTVLVDNVDSNKLVKPHPQSEYGPGHEGWWYEGYGIYRHVNLIITNSIHVSTWGTFVYTKHDSHKSAEVNMKVNISNQTDQSHHLVVKNIVFAPDGKRVTSVSDKYNIEANHKIELHQKALIWHPRLWSPDHPDLYKVITEVYSDGVLTDRYKTPLGIRWFKFTADSGFFLNGKHLQLRGMNIHAGFGGLGTALPDAANDYDVLLSKRMGCNIIRSAHNDPSPSLMEACDKLGMMLWAETRYLGKDTFALATLHDMIKRDRNHPSIICWSLANNSGRNNVRLTEMLEVMNTLAKKMDPTRPTAFGCEANGDPNWTGFACVTDIMGYNGGGMGRDDKDHKNYPDRKMLISEYSSGMGVRGEYKDEKVGIHRVDTLGDGRIFPLDATLFSQYDLCSSHEDEWSHIAKRP